MNHPDASDALGNLKAQTIEALYQSVRLPVNIHIELFVCVLKVLILIGGEGLKKNMLPSLRLQRRSGFGNSLFAVMGH